MPNPTSSPAESSSVSSTSSKPKRYALVGTGSRGLAMFAKPLLTDFPRTAKLVALCDANPLRVTAANRILNTELPTYTDFSRLLGEVDPDAVIIATKDATHAEYIVAALNANKRVYCEKPLCITAQQCRDILRAQSKSTAQCFVTHNMRYSHQTAHLKQLLDSGKIGSLRSIEFRETLDRSHGADYFRRWHAFKKNSGGLLIHKASHHFDLLNYLVGTRHLPTRLTAMGATIFYGSNNPYHHTRCLDCPHEAICDFHIDLRKDDNARSLYLEAEAADGYHRDSCVFNPLIDTEDQAAVLYSYDNNVRITYSLLAFASYEGMLIVFEGTEGRLEYETIHNTSWAVGNRIVPGLDSLQGARLTYFHPRKGVTPMEFPPAPVKGSHGGSDPQLLEEFFTTPWDAPASDRMATLDEAVQAILIGAAANQSIAMNSEPVDVQSLLAD